MGFTPRVIFCRSPEAGFFQSPHQGGCDKDFEACRILRAPIPWRGRATSFPFFPC